MSGAVASHSDDELAVVGSSIMKEPPFLQPPRTLCQCLYACARTRAPGGPRPFPVVCCRTVTSGLFERFPPASQRDAFQPRVRRPCTCSPCPGTDHERRRTPRFGNGFASDSERLAHGLLQLAPVRPGRPAAGSHSRRAHPVPPTAGCGLAGNWSTGSTAHHYRCGRRSPRRCIKTSPRKQPARHTSRMEADARTGSE